MPNGMDRFGALMQGKLPDRVPVVCNLLEQGARELGMPIKEYYSKGEYVAEGQLRLREKYGYDIVWGFHYVAGQAEMLGSRNTIFTDNGPPNVGHLIIQDYADIEKFEIPDDFSDCPSYREQLKTIDILKREQGGKYPVLSAVTGSFSLPPIIMGMDKWLDLLLTGPESLKVELLKKCSDFCVKLIQNLRAAGADIISYANPLATASFITTQQFQDLALEWVQRDIGTAGAEGLVYFNGGGRLNPMLSALLENTEVSAFYISPLDDVSEAKKTINGRGLLAAAINDIKLVSWSGEDIEQEVRMIMDAGKPGGGFIFGTLLMPYMIPEENIRTMLEAAYKYGTYSEETEIHTPQKSGLVLTGCGILKKEISFLIQKNSWPVKSHFLCSSLHVDFDGLCTSLNESLGKYHNKEVIVFYGTCHPFMDRIVENAQAVRTPGQNCVEMLLGKELFETELSAGAFFLMEDWARRWDFVSGRVFKNNDITATILQQEHAYLLGLRTPCSGDFSSDADHVSSLVSLPLRWLDVSLDHLEMILKDAIVRKVDK